MELVQCIGKNQIIVFARLTFPFLTLPKGAKPDMVQVAAALRMTRAERVHR